MIFQNWILAEQICVQRYFNFKSAEKLQWIVKSYQWEHKQSNTALSSKWLTQKSKQNELHCFIFPGRNKLISGLNITRKEQINEVEATLFYKIYIDSNVTWEKQIEKSMQQHR